MTEPAEQLAPLVTLPAAQSWRWHGGEGDGRIARTEGAYAQGALALSYRMPGGLYGLPPGEARLVNRDQPVPIGAMPDPQAWASRFLQAVIEVISSERPVSQLVRWTAPGVYDDIQSRQLRISRQRGRPDGVRPLRQQIASVHVCRPEPDVAEVAARLSVGQRSRAIAARLDYQRGRWTCTALIFD